MDSKLARLAGLIASWPGLVSRPDPGLVTDCLVLVGFLGDARRVVDVGSGGGLPGLPLKIARPDLELALVESNRRKAAFLVRACAELGLEGVTVVARRAEEAGRDPRLRESFDAAVVRALASTAVLAELCLPLVRVGGRLLAMKAGAEREAESARAALERLGGRLEAVADAPSPSRERGQVLVVAKVAPTPEEYPRRPGVPARRPLGI
jgi:16S rRNA (guanine527-N7)-methyltransferase